MLRTTSADELKENGITVVALNGFGKFMPNSALIGKRQCASTEVEGVTVTNTVSELPCSRTIPTTECVPGVGNGSFDDKNLLGYVNVQETESYGGTTLCVSTAAQPKPVIKSKEPK